MALTWWWLGLIGLAVIGFLGWRWWQAAKQPQPTAEDVPIAHASVLMRSPAYAALVRAEVWKQLGQVIAIGLIILGAISWMARWAHVDTVAPQTNSRDIMLCLDASSSMTQADAGVVAVYSELAQQLRGDRMGLVIWSGAAVPVFPLTDDNEFIADQLGQASAALVSRNYDFLAGTVVLQRRASSQIGDGLVSCLQRFDQQNTQRTRVVVLASDNDIQGPPIFTLTQAAQRAKDAGVIVHCIAADTTNRNDLAAFRAACESTGGSLIQLGRFGSDDASTIANQIDGLASNERPAAPRTLVTDAPWLGATLSGLGLLILAGLWIAARRRVR